MAAARQASIPAGPAGVNHTLNWMPALWAGALIILCYLPILGPLVHQWQANEEMGHGIFVPLFAAYVAWERRHSILDAIGNNDDSRSGSKWGLILIVWAFFQLIVSILGAELFLQRTAVLCSVAGVVLYLGGKKLLRVTAFPIALLLFSIPIPGIALKSITFPLQLLSSRVAESILDGFGYMAVRDGNIIELGGQQLSVVEACSGIRAILSLSFFSICYTYLYDSRLSMRYMMAIATIPVAVMANATRIVFTGILGEIDQKLATGFFHSASGWVIFVVSVVLLIVIHKILTNFWQDSSDPVSA